MGAALRMVIERGDPFLGICLGMQLLFDGSDENGGYEGLHVLPGRCRRFPLGLEEEAEPGAVDRPMIPASAKPDDVPLPQSVAFEGSEIEISTETPAEVAASQTPGLVPPPPEWSGPTVDEVGHGTTITVDELPEAATIAQASAAPSAGLTVAQTEAPAIIGTAQAPTPLMRRVKVPHMGWNEVEPTGDHYYFVHSYYVEPARPEDVMWMSRYGGIRFAAAVRHNNVLGCQFHPEKSQRAGLRFLRAFLLGGWG